MLKKLFAKKTPSEPEKQPAPEPEILLATVFQTALEHHQKGDLAKADELYRQILQHNPNHVDALHFLGVLAYQVGQHQEAVELISKAISFYPTASPMYCNLGLVQQALGNFEQAIDCYRQALTFQPDFADAYYNLGNALHAQGNLDSAIESYQQAISLNPNFVMAQNNLGNVFKQQNNLDAAIASYTAAIQLAPDYADAHNNLGIAFQAQRKMDLAIASYCAALAIHQDRAETLNNLGSVYESQAQYDTALEYYRKALVVKPDYAEAHYTLGALLLALGQFAEGWQHYEARHDPRLKNRQTFAPNLPFPQWQGESISGKSLLVWFEQGFGDEIQFCRYVAELKASGARYITWVCKKPLQSVFKTLVAVDSVMTPDEVGSVVAHDYWTFALSLALHCQTTAENIPQAVPYLYANPELVNKISVELSQISDFKVGVCWKGSAGHSNDENRSPGVAAFNGLFNADFKVKFFTLQPDTREEFMQAGGKNLFDRGCDIDASSFAEAAALIMNLDLVISCDTSICHLAGALGKPVWVILPMVADWRWLTEGEKSVWYPTARLFRQSQAGNWVDVFARVEKALQQVLTGKD